MPDITPLQKGEWGLAKRVPAKNGFAMLAVPAMHEKAKEHLPPSTMYEILISIPTPDENFHMWQHVAFYSNVGMQELSIDIPPTPRFLGDRGVFFVGRFRT